MRIVVYGTGAIGGTVAAALTHAGQPVTAIARGAQLDAIRAHGLRLRSPEQDFTVALDVVDSPQAARIGAGDAILLAMKGQHTDMALEALRAAGVTDQPIFCLQNGVANERRALRLFPNVHGVTVMMPVAFRRPGEVISYSKPQFGVFDIGRAVGGHDAADIALAEAVTAGNIAGYVSDSVMASKYGKLLLNLNNIVGAAFGPDADTGALKARARAEAEAVLTAAGIAWQDVGVSDARRVKHMSMSDVPGVEPFGSSTAQSLERGTGSVETDWLNGEIVLLGRLHGVATPVNAWLTGLAARLARQGAAPGSVPLSDVPALG
ncbi:ketopantoate reductase family protein [Sinisalibacter aestuarii]|uniref:2-dehydropantoate 2-reductase n=1 Tax=Sinisalibacter aestuarii TaxID=2949426 RepID=A0ABQ5LNA7_9RHOB|nr:2-dehydropantoate 2-reductase N-terminal domain-containing protein [Sinisalibacter aestuarii]GKY86495.1 2-dehydropantoate 2-reductase [Sinisalibacter aestuarii]